MFLLIPAIDVAAGRLAVATPDGPHHVDAFGGDPLTAARAYARAGAQWVHVVDMDLAYGIAAANPGAVGQIRAALPDIGIQASGGIGTWESARPYLDAGADHVVLGSIALTDQEHATTLLEQHADRVTIGLEVEEGRIRPRGGVADDLALRTTVDWLAAAGAPAFLVTCVTRVGALAGPDVDIVRTVAATGRPTFAAGGIRSVEDLKALRDVGAAGAVVGRAALEGDLDLADALTWARRERR
jgi:phosphoribosylformimino-5-aminoimidazole carboxamide ribonucleotide (ProFAR) isomerase